MTSKGKEPPGEDAPPLRGDAAFRAAKKQISDNNEAAYARGRQERAARNAQAIDKRRAADRETRGKMPRQPGRGGGQRGG